MSQKVESKSSVGKVVMTFFVAGAVSGLVFAALITRPGLQSFWFSTREWWIYPTWWYWLAAALLFIIGVLSAYHFSRLQQWLSLPYGSWHRLWLPAVLSPAVLLSLLWISNVPIYGPIFGPLIVSALVIIVLFSLSGRWDTLAAILILVLNPLVMLIANIPDLVLSESMGFKLFQSLRSLLGSSLLAGLIGLWLARSEKRKEPGPKNGSVHGYV